MHYVNNCPHKYSETWLSVHMCNSISEIIILKWAGARRSDRLKRSGQLRTESHRVCLQNACIQIHWHPPTSTQKTSVSWDNQIKTHIIIHLKQHLKTLVSTTTTGACRYSPSAIIHSTLTATNTSNVTAVLYSTMLHHALHSPLGISPY